MTFTIPLVPVIVVSSLVVLFIACKMFINLVRKADLRFEQRVKQQGQELELKKREKENDIDVELFNLLPTDWYDFWMEIKDYPSRRSLFLEKMDYPSFGGKSKQHPVFKTRLTPLQAAELARALGDGENSIKWFACDLAKFVKMDVETGYSMPSEEPYPYDPYDNERDERVG